MNTQKGAKKGAQILGIPAIWVAGGFLFVLALVLIYVFAVRPYQAKKAAEEKAAKEAAERKAYLDSTVAASDLHPDLQYRTCGAANLQQSADGTYALCPPQYDLKSGYICQGHSSNQCSDWDKENRCAAYNYAFPEIDGQDKIVWPQRGWGVPAVQDGPITGGKNVVYSSGIWKTNAAPADVWCNPNLAPDSEGRVPK